MVTVTSVTPITPTLFPLVPCGSGTGDMITLGCLATDFTPGSLTFSWRKNGAALTDFIQYPPVQKDHLYMGVSQIQVRKQDWEGKQPFYCAVTHAAGNVETHLIPPPEPYYKKPVLKVFGSSDEDNEASFFCYAKDFSPKEHEIKWLKDDGEIFKKLYESTTPYGEKVDVNGKTVYSAASFLTVQASDLIPEVTKFTCEFKGKDKDGDTFVNSSVIYKGRCSSGGSGCEVADVEVKIIPPAMKDMFKEKKGTVTCQVKVNRPNVEKILWEDKDGKNMLEELIPDRGSKNPINLSLDVTFDEWTNGIRRVCIVEHSEILNQIKTVYERKIEEAIQRPLVFMLPPVEQARKETVTLTCYVKDFFPKEVLVSWLVDDEPADSDYDITTTDPVENHGLYSVYGQLSLGLEQWKKSDSVYSCVVYHESVVNTTRAIVRSIAHRTSEQTNLVNLNMNIPETCKAH